jgi:hypothetical protein
MVLSEMSRSTEKDIEAYLKEHGTFYTPYSCPAEISLSEIHRRVYPELSGTGNAKIIRDLARFYASEENILRIWNRLTDIEKDVLGYIVRNDGVESVQTTSLYVAQYQLKVNSRYGNILTRSDNFYLRTLSILLLNFPKTEAPLLFPETRNMPGFIVDVLESVVPRLHMEFTPYIPAGTEKIINRENRLNDFKTLVQFSASEQLKVKEKTIDITKAKMAKLSEKTHIEDVFDEYGEFGTAKSTPDNRGFKVAFPMLVLSFNSGLLGVGPNRIAFPQPAAAKILSLPGHQLAMQLYKDYMENSRIQEDEYLPGISFNFRPQSYGFIDVRAYVAELVKKCPSNTWISYANFERYARIKAGNKIRNLVGGTMYRTYESRYGGDLILWEEFESPLIQLILSFLGAMGILNIAYTENVLRKEDRRDTYVGIAAFQITKLGEWILGKVESYDAPKAIQAPESEIGLVVLPDYSVIFSGLMCRIEHEPYFSLFLTKVSNDENASVYHLDFPSIIRAHNKGIHPEALMNRLIEVGGKALPDNVARSLTDWQNKVGRIKIQQFTVLTVDDPILLAEIRHIKGMDRWVKEDLKNAVAVEDYWKKDIKNAIERNGWLVEIFEPEE